jgi:hypothetical protein
MVSRTPPNRWLWPCLALAMSDLPSDRDEKTCADVGPITRLWYKSSIKQEQFRLVSFGNMPE